MKKNNLDDYINTLKPLAEQAPANAQPRNLPMRLKKQKKTSTKLGRYFIRVALAAVSIFFGVFIFALIHSNMRPSLTDVHVQEQKKVTAAVKKTATPVAKTVDAPSADPGVSPPPASVAPPSAPAVADAALPKPDTAVKNPTVINRETTRTATQESASTSKPDVVAAVPPQTDTAIKNPAVIGSEKTPPVVTQTAKVNTPPAQPIVKKETRREMTIPGVFPKPYKWQPTPTTVKKPGPVVAAAGRVAEPPVIEKPQVQAKKTEAGIQSAKPVAKNESNARTLAAITKHEPVIEKPVITEPVIEKPKKIPYSKQVADLPVEQRLAKAKELFDQQQWYDACDIYRKEMYNAGLNKSRRHEVVIRTAQCYYKLGYKSTADHLLGAVINEGGGWKKEAKAVLEAHK